ncbi:hypothetical protein [uncultured Parasphingopyxis sp.]|uniref:hypothetical protein n=1 Tax=uncultured Parasphingopyxis sp. TaxID=1547918 RepID=UPI00263223F3|nr:hypothetical protein [uncultured Parasphingopyxis sp.]
MIDGTDRFEQAAQTSAARQDNEEDRSGGCISIVAYLHEMCRLRSRHMRHPMFVNPAIEILLTLYIAREEGVRPPLASIAVANGLDADYCESIVKQLVENGFAEWHAMNPVSGIPIACISDDGHARVEALARSIANL